MNNYIASICEKYGTYIYNDLLKGSLEFMRVNTAFFTIY